MINPWDKIFVEDFETALKIADENYKTASNKFDLRARGLIKLLQANYSESLKDFKLLKEKETESNTISDDTYLYIGLCYYALDMLDDAVEFFESPVKKPSAFKYTTDISLPPAILYFFSLKTNNAKALSIAEKVLNKKRTPIAEFLTDKVSEKRFEDEFVISELENRRKCRLEFYKAIKAPKNKDNGKYIQHIQSCIKLKGLFLEFEYYISKVELEKINR
ncbi:MAG TPA: hypothetical protein VGQ59_01700 [Cyclobacteriaceae bacterium]|nr:hypothetical protein [Cyclobacteriaceae bacterium]